MKASKPPIAHLPELIHKLYELTSQFEQLFPGRKFTPDGHLVGSIGEVLAAHRYQLKLHPPSTENHNAETTTGLQVQIKATQGKSVALRSEPDNLIVLRLLRSGDAEEIFNGPGSLVWNACGAKQKNGQRSISLAKLQGIMNGVTPDQRIRRYGNEADCEP
jgi:hypothetical protein